MTSEPRDAGGALPPAKQCGTYRSGHSIHWIQARKAGEDRASRERGRVVETGPDWLVVRFPDGSRRRYGNHDIARLEELLDRYGRKVIVQERWNILRVRNYLIGISRMDPA